MNSPLDRHAGDLLTALTAVARLPLSEARLGRVTRLLLAMDEPGQARVEVAVSPEDAAPDPGRHELPEAQEPPLPPAPSSLGAVMAASPPVTAGLAAAPVPAPRPPEGLALLKVQTPQGPTNISVPHALLQEVASRLGGLPAAKALARQLAAQAPAAGRSGWVQDRLRAHGLAPPEPTA